MASTTIQRQKKTTEHSFLGIETKKIILSKPSKKAPVMFARYSPELPKLILAGSASSGSSPKKAKPIIAFRSPGKKTAPEILPSEFDTAGKSPIKRTQAPHKNTKKAQSPSKRTCAKLLTVKSTLPKQTSPPLSPLPTINSTTKDHVKNKNPVVVSPLGASAVARQCSLCTDCPTNLSTDVFIAGAGPAACGLLLNVERSGKLQNILEGSQILSVDDETQHSIIMVDKASDHGLGRGQLGKYLCPSNTSASCFVKNITRANDHAAYPPSDLMNLETLQSAKMLLNHGSLPADLTQVGQFLHASAQVLDRRFNSRHSKGKMLWNSIVKQIDVRDDETYDITCLQKASCNCVPTAHTFKIRARKIVLAVGGSPYLPQSIQNHINDMKTLYLKSTTKKKSRNAKLSFANKKVHPIFDKPPLLISGEEVLKKDGLYKVFQRLKPLCYLNEDKVQDMSAPQIVIVGGSHSALAAANLLLTVSRKDKNLLDILSYHRQEIRDAARSAPSSVPIHEYDIFDNKLSTENGDIEKKSSNTENKNKDKQAPMPIYSFKCGDIVCLHRSPIRLFFQSLKNAESAGYKIDETAISRKNKRVHPHTGLRGPARNLVIKVKKGREHCVKFQRCHCEADIQKKIAKMKPMIVIYSTGYTANAGKIKFFIPTAQKDSGHSRTEATLCKTASGGILVGETGEVLRQTETNDTNHTEGKVAVKNCFSLGLGTIYGADHIAIGGESDAHEKGADGVNLYVGALGTHVRNRIWPDVFKKEIEKEEMELKERDAKVQDIKEEVENAEVTGS